MNSALEHQVSGLLPRGDVSGRQRDEMFALLARHFDGVGREYFERDLAEKNWVVELRREGRLMGFSTLLVKTERLDGEVITAIYSGDTIVAPEAWGSPLLARTWIQAVNASAGAASGPAVVTGCCLLPDFVLIAFCRFFGGSSIPGLTLPSQRTAGG